MSDSQSCLSAPLFAQNCLNFIGVFLRESHPKWPILVESLRHLECLKRRWEGDKGCELFGLDKDDFEGVGATSENIFNFFLGFPGVGKFCFWRVFPRRGFFRTESPAACAMGA
jgi:hypothetical protein